MKLVIFTITELQKTERMIFEMLDVLIIGGGPAGLSAAVYTKRANLNVKVIEKVAFGCGQIVYAEQIDNYLGFSSINGYDLGMKFRQHAEAVGVPVEEAEGISYKQINDHWEVTYANGEKEETKTIIYCVGAAHRHLNIPGEDALFGGGVSYCATCDGAFYRDKVVAVVGGGNTALGEALYLSNLAKKVYLIHRRDSFRGFSQTVEQLKQKENIELLLNENPVEIIGMEKVSGLKLENTVTGKEQELNIDGVFIAVGMQPVTDSLKDIVKLNENGYVIADESGITSARGFFVAGDVRTKPLRQVVTAVSDGANAAASVKNYISHV